MEFQFHAFESASPANGPGLRAVVWFQGCTLGCPGCFNPGTHDQRWGTAADICGVLRKERWDEVFFIDLPRERKPATALAICLARNRRGYRDFDLSILIGVSDGISSAELEQALFSALYPAFAECEQARLETRHLAKVLTNTVPLAQSMGCCVARSRAEARDKWRPAAREDDLAGEGGGAPASPIVLAHS